jgi:hypothetical protein
MGLREMQGKRQFHTKSRRRKVRSTFFLIVEGAFAVSQARFDAVSNFI